MYYFIIEKETNNIICKSLETNETIATAENTYEKDDSDFWTSIEIDGEVFDINIYYEDDEIFCLETNNIPDSLYLYRLRKDDEGLYTNECDDFEAFGLTFEN